MTDSARSTASDGASASPAVPSGEAPRNPALPVTTGEGGALPGPLDFTPVSVRARVDGWTPERQRLYVAALARWGSGRRAAGHVGLTPQSAARLCRRPDAASFSAACERAWTIGKIARRAAARRKGRPIHSPGGELHQSMNLSASPAASARKHCPPIVTPGLIRSPASPLIRSRATARRRVG
jgi:hypothetical protein